MSKLEVSAQDRKEIENCMKHLVHKFVQTVVQSRQGDRVATHSKKLSSSSDWFNLTIPDQSDVLEATKHVYPGHVDLSQPLCVEISLRTSEQEKMTLEYWTLQQTDKTSMPDSSFKVPLTVYNAIGVLLKSVVLVSRATPVYQLSRRQKNDNFSICYSVCLRDPVFFSQSDDFQRQLVGIVPSPLGAVASYVVYRTKLSTYAQQSISDLTSTIKDDHFNRPLSRNKNVRHSMGSDLADYEMTPGTSPGHKMMSVPHDGQFREGVNSRQKRAAFGIASADSCKQINEADIETDMPFATLLVQASSPPVVNSDKESSDSNSTSSHGPTETGKEGLQASIDSRITASCVTMKDDFVMIELKAPFVGNEEDLGRFYRDCQMAPTLSMFEPTGSVQDMINSITDQLAQFEASASEFNEFVNSLQDIE